MLGRGICRISCFSKYTDCQEQERARPSRPSAGLEGLLQLGRSACFDIQLIGINIRNLSQLLAILDTISSLQNEFFQIKGNCHLIICKHFSVFVTLSLVSEKAHLNP